MGYSRCERRQILQLVRKKIDRSKTLEFSQMPAAALAEVTLEAVTLSRCALFAAARGLEATGLEERWRALLAKRDVRAFRALAAELLAECEATVFLIERGL